MILLILLFCVTASELGQAAPLSKDDCNAHMARYFKFNPGLLNEFDSQQDSLPPDHFYASSDPKSEHIWRLHGLTVCDPFYMCIRAEANSTDVNTKLGCHYALDYGKEFACVIKNTTAECVVKVQYFGESSTEGFTIIPMGHDEFTSIAKDLPYFQKSDQDSPFSERLGTVLSMLPFEKTDDCRLDFTFLNVEALVAVDDVQTLKAGLECRLRYYKHYPYSTLYMDIFNMLHMKSEGQCYKVENNEGISKNYCVFKSLEGGYFK